MSRKKLNYNIVQPILNSPKPIDDSLSFFKFAYVIAGIAGIVLEIGESKVTVIVMVFFFELLVLVAHKLTAQFKLRRLSRLRFSLPNPDITYSELLPALAMSLAATSMSIENKNGKYLNVISGKVKYRIILNDDRTFSLWWYMSIGKEVFDFTPEPLLYKKLVADMGIIAYSIQKAAYISATENDPDANIDPNVSDSAADYVIDNNMNGGYYTPMGTHKPKLNAISIIEPIIAGVVVIMAIVGLWIFGGTDYVAMVKYSSPSGYPDISYGMAFDSYFENPEWEHCYDDNRNSNVVIFTGKDLIHGNVTFEFTVNDDEETIEITYCDFNNEYQLNEVWSMLLFEIFDEYEQSYSKESYNYLENVSAYNGQQNNNSGDIKGSDNTDKKNNQTDNYNFSEETDVDDMNVYEEYMWGG